MPHLLGSITWVCQCNIYKYINNKYINIQGRCTLSFKTYSDICVTYVSISIAAKKRH